MQRLSPVSLKQVLSRAPVGIKENLQERKLFVQESTTRALGSLTNCIFNVLYFIFMSIIFATKFVWFSFRSLSILVKWLMFAALLYGIVISLLVAEQVGLLVKADALERFFKNITHQT